MSSQVARVSGQISVESIDIELELNVMSKTKICLGCIDVIERPLFEPRPHCRGCTMLRLCRGDSVKIK